MWKFVRLAKKIIVYILSYSRRVSYIKNYKECIAINPELDKPAEGEKEWLDKLSQEALFMGKPREALIFSFGPDSDNYYIIPEWLFKELNEVN